MYFGSNSTTYICPKTGAHFDFQKISETLDLIR